MSDRHFQPCERRPDKQITPAEKQGFELPTQTRAPPRQLFRYKPVNSSVCRPPTDPFVHGQVKATQARAKGTSVPCSAPFKPQRAPTPSPPSQFSRLKSRRSETQHSFSQEVSQVTRRLSPPPEPLPPNHKLVDPTRRLTTSDLDKYLTENQESEHALVHERRSKKPRQSSKSLAIANPHTFKQTQLSTNNVHLASRRSASKKSQRDPSKARVATEHANPIETRARRQSTLASNLRRDKHGRLKDIQVDDGRKPEQPRPFQKPNAARKATEAWPHPLEHIPSSDKTSSVADPRRSSAPAKRRRPSNGLRSVLPPSKPNTINLTASQSMKNDIARPMQEKAETPLSTSHIADVQIPRLKSEIKQPAVTPPPPPVVEEVQMNAEKKVQEEQESDIDHVFKPNILPAEKPVDLDEPLACEAVQVDSRNSKYLGNLRQHGNKNLELAESVVKTCFEKQDPHLNLAFLGLVDTDLSIIADIKVSEEDRAMRYVNLSRNRLTKLPLAVWEWFDTSNVVRLNLQRNCLQLLHICWSESSLVVLDLSRNKLTSVPPEITHLKRLQSLRLKKNNISILPSGLVNLKELRLLDVSENRLRTLPNDFADEDSVLSSLDVSGNPKFQEFPECAEKLTQLEDLHFENTPLHSAKPVRSHLAESPLEILKSIAACSYNKGSGKSSSDNDADDIQSVG